MSVQHKYTVAETVTQNTARVQSIVLMPNQVNADDSLGQVEVNYQIGEESGGNFVVNETETVILRYNELPGGTVNTLNQLESQALTYGVNNGIFPAGTEEPTP